MPNRYTQPVQSQFIPTFVPFDPQIASNIATGLQRRQEKNIADMGALEETFNQISALEEEKPQKQQILNEYRDRLNQFVESGDFTDAGPQLRRVARSLQEDLQGGELGRIQRNYETAQKTIENIEESDLPRSEKEALKDTYLMDFNAGDKLSEFRPADYVDVGNEARNIVNEVPATKIEQQTGWRQTSDGTWTNGVTTRQSVPQQVVDAFVIPSLKADPKTMDYLRQKALTRTSGQDTFFREKEDGTREEISRQEKIDDLTNQAIQGYANAAAGLKTGMQIKQQARGTAPEGFEGQGSYNTVELLGETKVREIGVTSFSNSLDDAERLRRQGEDEAADEIEYTLQKGLTTWQQESKNVSEDDVEFMKEVREKEQGILSEPIAAGPMVGGGAKEVSDKISTRDDLREEIGSEALSRYERLTNNFNSWADKKGGITTNNITFDASVSNATLGRVNRLINTEPENWRIAGQTDVDSQEFIQKQMEEGSLEFLSYTRGDDYLPGRINVRNSETGERFSIVEKTQGGDATDSILSLMGDVGNQAIKERRVEPVQPSFEEPKNQYEKLPPNLRRDIGGDFVSVGKSKEGYTVSVGSEDNPRTFSYADYLSDPTIQNVIGGSIENFRQELNQRNKKHGYPLTNEDISKILHGDVDQQLESKVQNTFGSTPFDFPTKYTALVGATTIQ